MYMLLANYNGCLIFFTITLCISYINFCCQRVLPMQVSVNFSALGSYLGG